jgi:hypothetical protein
MAHFAGADEAGAQQAEEQLWREFMLTRRLESSHKLAVSGVVTEASLMRSTN